jgi:hypothetical protein
LRESFIDGYLKVSAREIHGIGIFFTIVGWWEISAKCQYRGSIYIIISACIFENDAIGAWLEKDMVFYRVDDLRSNAYALASYGIIRKSSNISID